MIRRRINEKLINKNILRDDNNNINNRNEKKDNKDKNIIKKKNDNQFNNIIANKKDLESINKTINEKKESLLNEITKENEIENNIKKERKIKGNKGFEDYIIDGIEIEIIKKVNDEKELKANGVEVEKFYYNDLNEITKEKLKNKGRKTIKKMKKPKIIKVIPNDNFELITYFDNGIIKIFNMSELISDIKGYHILKNKTIFKNLKIENYYKVISWNENIDIDREYILENGENFVN